MSLTGKNIIVTGATAGFGSAFASQLSREGANVFFGGRHSDCGTLMTNDTNAAFHTVNIANQESSETFFQAAEEHFGGPQTVDAIFLNAGVPDNGASISKHSADNFDYIFSFNVQEVILGLDYSVPLLRRNGSIVVTSSMGSFLPMGPNGLVQTYAAQFAESEDEHLQSLSIVAINAAAYASDMLTQAMGSEEAALMAAAKAFNPSRRPGNAEELAVTVCDYIQGNLPYKSGEAFVADADVHFPSSEYFERMCATASMAA